MATLAELARQYLNQALPDISGIFKPRADTPVEEIPVEETVTGITPQLLQSTGRGGDDFSVYNPDPNKVRTDYRPYDYRQAMAKSGVGIPSGILSNSEFLYGPKSELEGLLNFIPGIGGLKRGAEFVGGILDPYLPVNQRSIMENEARGMGILTDDIGRIVQGSGDYDTGANVMAGYNLNKITPETIQKRRDMINEKMKDPKQKAARLKALDDFENMMFGTTGVKARTNAIVDEKTRAKGNIPLSDQIAMNQAKSDFQQLVDEGEEEQELLDFLRVTDPDAIPTGITAASFPGVGLNRRNIVDIQDTIERINRSRERERQRAAEAAFAAAGGDRQQQAMQRARDQQAIDRAYRDETGAGSSYSGGERTRGDDTSYNDPFDPGGGE